MILAIGFWYWLQNCVEEQMTDKCRDQIFFPQFCDIRKFEKISIKLQK
jgi:hypothetical protein